MSNCAECTDAAVGHPSECLKCDYGYAFSDDLKSCIGELPESLTNKQSIVTNSMASRLLIRQTTHLRSFTCIILAPLACHSHLPNCDHCHDFGGECKKCEAPYSLSPDRRSCGCE